MKRKHAERFDSRPFLSVCSQDHTGNCILHVDRRDDGKLKIEERLWDFTSSGSVHRRNPLFHSRPFRCCLLHLRNCFNTRTDAHRPCLNKNLSTTFFLKNLTQCLNLTKRYNIIPIRCLHLPFLSLLDLVFSMNVDALEGKAVEHSLLASALQEVNLVKNASQVDFHRRKQTNALFC